MRLLLDTHVALWLLNVPENLSSVANLLLSDNNNELYISIVSAWEIAIKNSLHKLPGLPDSVSLIFSKINIALIEIIPVKQPHIEMVETLPFIHRDPFDRLIIAIAMCENLTLLTADRNIPKYDIQCIW